MFRLMPLLAFVLSAFPQGASASPARNAGEGRPYVETSYLVAPKVVGPFTLEERRYDPANKYAGAGFRYAMEGRQELRIDVYVYPAGQMDQDEAVDAGLQAFRRDLAGAVEHGTYARLVDLDQTPFPLDPPPVAAQVPANAIDAAAIAASARAAQVTGERLRMTLHMQPGDWPMRSNGYLFYRQLHYFKLRVSAAQQRIAQADFDAAADQAARLLVPALQAIHVGACADATLRVDPAATPEQSAVAIATQLARIAGRNCHGSVQSAGIDRLRNDAEIVEIGYGADEWTSR